MSAGPKCLGAAVSIINDERKRAGQKSGRGDSQMTASDHFRQLTPKNGHRRANQTGERPDKDRFIPKGQSKEEKSERKIPLLTILRVFDKKKTTGHKQSMFERNWTPVKCVGNEKRRVGSQQEGGDEGSSAVSGSVR